MFGIDSRLRADYDNFENLRRIGLRVALPLCGVANGTHPGVPRSIYFSSIVCVCLVFPLIFQSH
jgi:hypothetical protein